MSVATMTINRQELFHLIDQLPDEKLSVLFDWVSHLGLDPFYGPSNMERLRESEQQFREGKVVVKTMEELEAMADG